VEYASVEEFEEEAGQEASEEDEGFTYDVVLSGWPKLLVFPEIRTREQLELLILSENRQS